MSDRSLAEVVEDALAAVPAPGAVVALAGRGDTSTVAVGTRGMDPASAPIAPEDWFQIGSVTKSMTATAVLQLVADGGLAVDSPVVGQLPGFRLHDDAATHEVTIAHLLSHTSAIDVADDFTNTGDGDDCLARYLDEAVAGSAVLDPVGARFSYCNGGYSILGRLLEVRTGQPWDDVVADRIFGPAGMDATTLRRRPADDARVVPGHRIDRRSRRLVAEPRMMPSSAGPAGNVVCDAASLLRYASALFGDGRLLPEWLVAEATRSHAPMRAGGYGFGWMVLRPGVVAHGGSTVGHTSFLGAVPDAGAALAVLANGPGAGSIAAAVQGHLSGRPVSPPEPGRGTLEVGPAPTEVVGTYRRRHVEAVLAATDEGLTVTLHRTGPAAILFGDELPARLEPLGGGRYSSLAADGGDPHLWDLLDPDREGRPTALLSERVHRRWPVGESGLR